MPRIRQVLAGILLCCGASSVDGAAAQGEEVRHAVQVGEVTLSYRVVGHGEPLLLLHYFGGCGEVWTPFIERLSGRYRLIVPDLRGHGRTTNPSGRFRHDEAATDILGLLDHLGLDRVRAIGLSSGGMTLLHVATREPERLTAMVLVGATSHFPAPARRIMAQSHPDSLTVDAFAEWSTCSTRGDVQTRATLMQFHGMKDSYDDMDFTGPRLGTIRARTLVVHGDRDEFFPVEIAVGMYEAIPQAALWVVPGGGHLPIFGDRAEAFVQEVLAFLER